MNKNYLQSIRRQFEYYKSLGENTFKQLNNENIHWRFNNESNSIAVIVKHIVGNQLSRFTNFKTEDGEKDWRKRDDEFVDTYSTKTDMLREWEKGWNCLFDVLDNISENELDDIVYIRNQGHTITEALNRQLCHYPYHIGQIVYIGKMIKDNNWQTLSIAKNKSAEFNNVKFSQDKSIKHFTEK